jgi:pSer/pThr/pTyr-binding forkhead associated (FHA) protein
VAAAQPAIGHAPAQPPISTSHATEVAAPRLAAGRFLLVAAQGPYAGQQYPLQRLPLLVGRGAEAGIALDDDLNVSRSHAELYAAGGALCIRDMESMHGTQVNGVPVSDQALQPGDRISVGGTTFVLRENS